MFCYSGVRVQSKGVEVRQWRGGKYVSKVFEAFMREHGILHQISGPYTPQKNGVA